MTSDADRMRAAANCVVCGTPCESMHCDSPTCPWPKHGACKLSDREGRP